MSVRLRNKLYRKWCDSMITRLPDLNNWQEPEGDEMTGLELERAKQEISKKEDEIYSLETKLDDLLGILKEHSKLSCAIANYKDVAHEVLPFSLHNSHLFYSLL